ncbi:phosphatase PAP2 family protein [Alicyclobacillus dauci]|uniref:Phosphatase PAP2 family protein n=1 Tax=Alicyclobacillus dauci TaxID=1475485 RepID=A0ABY6Z3U7_9BACL|nr:phosphatase PAP2 family protein [Alicyclobacillus dauci]WAH36665.1 phosphatase PAP2 family protein [Alicyclobacillus dauci]
MATPDFPLPKSLSWQYHFILWIQSFHVTWVDNVATVLSYLGTDSFYMFVLPVVFLAVSRKNGLRLAYVFLTSMFFNAWLKSALHIARPIGVPGIRSGYISSATGLSMPSGHAQGTMTLFVALSRWFSRKWIMWVGVVLVFGIGFSRVHLGLHWPMDILVGWGLGLFLGSAGWIIGRWWSYRGIPFQLALFFSIIFPAVLLYFNHDPLGSEYATFMFAIGTGSTLERKYVHCDLDGRWWKRICAAVIGLGGMVAIQWILQNHLLDLPWRLVRDLLIGWWTTILAPWLFLKIDLYKSEETSSFVS